MAALRACISALAADRLISAGDVIRGCAPGTHVLVVGASRGAADDLARRVAATVPATFGIERLSLTQFAAVQAIAALAADGIAPSTWLGAEAVAARAVFQATRDGSLTYFAPVAGAPSFPRALARTLQELRLAGIQSAQLSALPLGGRDLARLLERFEACFRDAAAVDRAALLSTAARIVRGRSPAEVVILLDLPLDQPADRELIDAVIASSATVFATALPDDVEAVEYYRDRGAEVEQHERGGGDDLAQLRRFLFNTREQPPKRSPDGSVEVFSAPGEARECVEIARRILRETRRGVRFDEIAVLVRSPQNYFGLLEHALGRAGIPGWFDRGTRRPHPAGRAFLALIACAAEQLSAARFAEYLSLGQVPSVTDADAERHYAWSTDEAFGRSAEIAEDELESEVVESSQPQGDDPAVFGGTLRAPWRWEKLLTEAAVIGQDAARWKRRLAGKRRELELQLADVTRQEGADGARVRGLGQLLEQLDYLTAFALPLIDELESWPRHATWGEWLDRFEQLAPRVLMKPAHVLRVLADLRPMADVGPVDLDEARRVLSERLLNLQTDPPARRYGRVFVSSPQQVRGRSFRAVFVPGLAERLFPQKPREDALLLDRLRADVSPSLPTQHRRLAAERLLLQLAAGAASEQLYVSYPRIELAEARARVPSFYALDVIRAATGSVPDQEWLEARARMAGDASLAWPAPAPPEEAIDDQEHDLAVLRRLLDEKDPNVVRGHAHYLLNLNSYLRRSVIDRWARGQSRWLPGDGLVGASLTIRKALDTHRPVNRAYSVSALQRFSACPYQFVLAAIYRLQPMEQPEPLQRMDPLTRGAIFHDVQARFLRTLLERGALPVTAANLDSARAVLDEVVAVVEARQHDDLAPAVERVWMDEIASLRRDLRGWLEHLAQDGTEWMPRHFEFAFGAVPGERDAASVADDVTLPGGFKLRGAIDLIEEHHKTKLLRVTDHKTGRKPDRIEKVITGGGAILQPVLYGMAAEAALGRSVFAGRLFYCSSAGSFDSHSIPITETTKAAGLEVLQVIDRAFESGFLAASPTEEACSRCDFISVCGASVFRRVGRKPQAPLADLQALRSRP